MLRNEKGVYGVSDLNRVESAVAEVAVLFPALDIGLTLETKTDWKLPGAFSPASWPVESQMQRYLENVESIRSAFGISSQLPKTMTRLTWSGANSIEEVLQTAWARADATIQTFRYSGEIYAGEE